MRIDKMVKALLGVVSKDSSRFAITGVYINDGFAVATNGAGLVKVPYAGELTPGIHGGLSRDGWMGTYPNYKQVIPTHSKHSLPLNKGMIALVREVVDANKRDGVKPARKWNSSHTKHPQFTAIRFNAGGAAYFYDPFLFWTVLESLRKAGHPALSLELNGPTEAARIVTLQPEAVGVIMPMRSQDRFVTVGGVEV